MENLQKLGWFISNEGLEVIFGKVGENQPEKVHQYLLDNDIRDYKKFIVSTEINKKDEIFKGQKVLQIVKIRNIAAPKANEESKVAPRCLQIELTDGVNSITGFELERINEISLNTPPGTKIFLTKPQIPLMHGILLLRPNEIKLLGGKVQNLIEKWEINQTLMKYAKSGRNMRRSGGAPPWIPFGEKIQQTNNKNVLKSSSEDKNKTTKENNEFDVMRNEAIAEAAKTGSKKIFGGGNHQIIDHNLKKIMEKGYSEDIAKNALKITKNNLEKALYYLKRRNDKNEVEVGLTFRNNKRIGRKDKTEEDVSSTKPAGNVSLFDFLTDKFPMNKDTTEKSESNQETKPRNAMYKSTDSNAFNKDTHQIQKDSYQPEKTEHHNSSKSHVGRKFENNISSSFANQNSSNHWKSSRYHSSPSRKTNEYRGSVKNNTNSNDQKISMQSNSSNTHDFRTDHKRDNISSSKSQHLTQNIQKNYYSSRNRGTEIQKSRFNETDVKNETNAVLDTKINYPKTNSQSNQSNSNKQNYNFDLMPTKSRILNGLTLDPRKVISNDGAEIDDSNWNIVNTEYVQENGSYPFFVTKQINSYFKTLKLSHPELDNIQNSSKFNWQIGDRCLAKYWDDKQYYEAEITGVSDTTCVVFFTGYGNYEEVLKSDCLPMNSKNTSESRVQDPNANRTGSTTRSRHERQVYVPPPKRDT